MKILILGLNYAPEPVGTGPYTAGMAEFLSAQGHEVTVVCGKPYYPVWKINKDFDQPGTITSVENGVEVHRVPIYVPARPSGAKRLVHHASFALSALPKMLKLANAKTPDIILNIAPSLISTATARLVAQIYRVKLWLHIQDFEVEAAFATGLLKDGGLVAGLARAFENWCLKGAKVSTISPQMCKKLVAMGARADSVYEFRNWARIDDILPLSRPSNYREAWGIKTAHVALYSGNLGNKQGIEIIPEVAKLMKGRNDLTFIICGNGASCDRLRAAAEGLDNIRFYDLQPMGMMGELLGLATVHLLPQIAEAADLVLPSKLTNMLASGRPVLATAEPDTGLALEVDECGVLSPPGDAVAMANALSSLLDDEDARIRLGAAARIRAEERWSKVRILDKFSLALEREAKRI